MMIRSKTVMWKLAACLVIVALISTGCGGGSDLAGMAGGLIDATRTTSQIDTDYDGIPDGLEHELGTDPLEIDSDMDGLTDHYELWGVQGLPVGTIGSLEGLPDLDEDGIHAALDRNEAGSRLNKHVSALDDERIRVVDPNKETVPNDQDGDGIPSDYELHGFYYQIDPATGLDYFYKWDGDWTKEYILTDPTQWSTDGDPWSDWEEATKRNMDQRVKHPGDHPCIPAYPEIYGAITGYAIDLNEDITIESSDGGSAQKAWSNDKLLNGWESQSEHLLEIGGWGQLKFESGIVGMNLGVPPAVRTKTTLTNEIGIKVGYHYNSTEVTYGANNFTNDTSGMTATQWGSATTTSGDTLNVARLTLNMKLVNTGTLPAHDPRIWFNLKIGNTITHSFLVEYPGELEAKALNTVDWVVATDGVAASGNPGGSPLMLSIYQLRSIQSGAPISIEPLSFDADTLVSIPDPDTGRRSYVSLGPWSPYEAALQNVTAKVVMDFNEDPQLSQTLFSELPAKKVSDIRIFAYNNRGNYVGSPPVITLAEAFLWTFGFHEEDESFVVALTDPITGYEYKSYMLDWEISLDQSVFNRILNETPEVIANLFTLPLEPGNPVERTYVAKAPPSGLRAKPRIYWATVNPQERVVRAYSRDIAGIQEMRFKPNDSYEGEEMFIANVPEDPHMRFAYTYVIPPQYRWTGQEKVVATNGRGEKSELPIEFEVNELGVLVNQDTTFLGWIPTGQTGEESSAGFNLAGEDVTFQPFDVTLRQYRDGGVLYAELIPHNAAGVYDIGVVADLDQITYNYLRKRPYLEQGDPNVPLVVPLDDPLYPLLDPVYYHVFAVRTNSGKVALFTPMLTERTVTENYINAVDWRLYEGL
jgi:hypothetical protein